MGHAPNSADGMDIARACAILSGTAENDPHEWYQYQGCCDESRVCSGLFDRSFFRGSRIGKSHRKGLSAIIARGG